MRRIAGRWKLWEKFLPNKYRIPKEINVAMTRKLTSWFYIKKCNFSFGHQWQNVPVSPVQVLHYNALLLPLFTASRSVPHKCYFLYHIDIIRKSSYLTGTKWKGKRLLILYFTKKQHFWQYQSTFLFCGFGLKVNISIWKCFPKALWNSKVLCLFQKEKEKKKFKILFFLCKNNNKK